GGDAKKTGAFTPAYSHFSYVGVNRGFLKGCYGSRHTVCSRQSPGGSGSANILRLAPPTHTQDGWILRPRPLSRPTCSRSSAARAPKSCSLSPSSSASSCRLSTWPTSRRSPTPFFMASLLCCGPKLAACGIVLSAWGVIMLIMLGIFFNVHSAVLIEDVPFTEKDFENGPQDIYKLYEQVSYNCFIAAGLYLLLGGFSFCQVRLNKRKEYMVR
uniref:Ribonuclease K n=4 Tax=Sus scrofa TaxID=9823 RepID=A0A8D1ZWX9_PIG